MKFLLLIILSCASNLIRVSLGAPQVVIGQVTLTGTTTATTLEFFGGIPFAQPPTGNLRFAPPAPITSVGSTTSFDATNFGATCMQLPAVNGMSENCLTLNVLRPGGIAAGANLPVMVWIYGGGFDQGGSAAYTGNSIVSESIARKTPVIYMDMNYRLGPFGFPTGSEAEANGALNLGLKDQLAALQWVQSNIANFGGDKTKVTVFGQSAGSISIADLFLNSKLETLVWAAIMESGSQGTIPVFTADSGSGIWQALAQGVPSCATVNPNSTFACLRAADPNAILSAGNAAGAKTPQQFTWAPVIDGDGGLIPDVPSKLLASGSFSPIPFMAGSTLDDGTEFTNKSVNSDLTIIQSLQRDGSTISTTPTMSLFQSIFLSILVQLYSDNPADGSPYNTGNNTFNLSPFFKKAAAIVGDVGFTALRRYFMNAAAAKNVKVYGYIFSDPQSNSGANGVAHASELQYIYGGIINAAPGSSAASLAYQMLDYWISFAVSQDPNDGKGNSRPNWPQYTSSSQNIIQLSSQNLTVIPDNFREAQMDIINVVPAIFGH